MFPSHPIEYSQHSKVLNTSNKQTAIEEPLIVPSVEIFKDKDYESSHDYTQRKEQMKSKVSLNMQKQRDYSA